jgi:hypothetical protein
MSIQSHESPSNTSSPMGWGELSLYIVYAVLLSMCWVLAAFINELAFSITLRALGCFLLYIKACFGVFFLLEVLDIQRNVCGYKKSYLLLQIRSDLIFLSMSNLLFFVFFSIGFALGVDRLFSFSTIVLILPFLWYESFRYVLNKEGLYQPGVIKSYVWLWCKRVVFPPCVVLFFLFVWLFFGGR